VLDSTTKVAPVQLQL